MVFFRQDPLLTFKKELNDAIDTGNTAELEKLLQSGGDIPIQVLKKPLEKAISNGQVKIAEIILKNSRSSVDKNVLADVVWQRDSAMFRLLRESGFDFNNSYFSDDNQNRKHYYITLKYLEKDMEHENLKKLFNDLKKELTTPSPVEENLRQIAQRISAIETEIQPPKIEKPAIPFGHA